MKPNQLKSLKVGHKVAFIQPGRDRVDGEVVEVGYSAVKIKWADDQFSVLMFDDADDNRLPFIELS